MKEHGMNWNVAQKMCKFTFDEMSLDSIEKYMTLLNLLWAVVEEKLIFTAVNLTSQLNMS